MKISGSESFTRWLAPSLLLAPPCPSCSLRLRKLLRLLRLAQGSQGFLRPKEGPRDPGRLRAWGGWGEQAPWVWLKTQVCQRLPKAPKAFWGPRKVPGVLGARGWEAARGWESKGSKVPESDWRPKTVEGFQRLPRLPKAPGRSQGPRKAQGMRGSEGRVGEQGIWFWLKTQGCKRLSKAPKAF